MRARNGKRRILFILAAVCAAGLISDSAPAAELGMTAPTLSIAEWVKGKAVDIADGKGEKIYVVEFWATWCPPCRASIPHLTKLQKEYADEGVVIIGVSSEDASKVKPFVAEQGDAMDYVVAIDNNRETSSRYMQAFNQRGIPHAFIIDRNGAVAWHGHPMSMDEPLKRIISGNYDLAAKQQAERAKQQAERAKEQMIAYFNAMAGEIKPENAGQMGGEVVKGLWDSAELLGQFAWIVATHPRIKHRDLDMAEKASSRAVELSQGKEANILDTHARVLFEQGKQKEAIASQKRAIEAADKDSLKEELGKTLESYEKGERPAE